MLQISAARLLVDLRGDLWLGGKVDLTDVARVREGVASRFDALSLDRQRELVRGLVAVTVHPGRAPERVIVEHKVASSLNISRGIES